MSMLAGPRRKQKVINLRAKNNAWSNDSEKFGQRMLEKMGWSSGKGLGAKENGIVEHVVARFKNDDRGLGYEDKNDQWTKHEDDFNALLANLSNDSGTEVKLHSGVSLEHKSKKSKARVHYHKFTRGKDLTQYSEKDLANIFGKKTLSNEEKPEETSQEETEKSQQIFTEKGSMEDYFKTKLAALKSKHNLSKLDTKENDYAFKGFSNGNNDVEEQQDCGFKSFSFYTQSNDDVKSDPEQSIKKKKKKKAMDEISEENVEKTSDEQCSEDVPKKKKSKKAQSEVWVEEVVSVEEETTIKKKSKKKKNTEEIQPADEVLDTKVTVEDYVPKKKKKRKNKSND